MLPGGIEGRHRIVRITIERIRHIAERRPDWLIFCLANMAQVLRQPEYLGYRDSYPNCVELVRQAGLEGRLLAVVVKFLDAKHEAWVVTTYPLSDRDLTRRLRTNTMRKVGGES